MSKLFSSRRVAALSTCCALFAPLASQAGGVTTLNFEDAGDYATLTSFGSNASNTPNIAVSYSTLYPNLSLYYSAMYQWTAGYGDLPAVAYAANNGYLGDVTLTPSSGAKVTLSSFELAGYYEADIANQTIEVLDASNTVLWSDSGNVPGAGPSHATYSPNVTSSGPISIVFGPSWDTGIEGVTFSESDVPEPADWALMLVGLCGLGAVLRTRGRTVASPT